MRLSEVSQTSRKGKLLRLAICLVTGAFFFLAVASFDIWLLGWIAPVGLVGVVIYAPNKKSAILCSWLTGIVMSTGGFYWIGSLLERFAGFPPPLSWIAPVVLATYQALVFVFFAWTLRSIDDAQNTRLPLAILAPVCMCLPEMLFPQIFPYYLAISQAWNIPVIQIAEFTGPLGVTAMLLATGGAVIDFVRKRSWKSPAITGAIVTSLIVWGFVKASSIESQLNDGPKVTVGVVQGNIGFNQKGQNGRMRWAKQLEALQLVSANLASKGAELIVWSESSYPYSLARDIKSDFPLEHPKRIKRFFDTPIITGSLTREKGINGRAFNSMVMLDSEGNVAGMFDKMYLLLFGEYIPESLSFVKKFVPPGFGSLTKGTEVKALPLKLSANEKNNRPQAATYNMGPLICYEDIIPAFGRALAPHNPHLLINITNDGWFGDTSEPWQHMALSVFRAVEMRTDLVRSVNTGVSAHINAAGRVVHQTYAVDPAINPTPASGLLVDAALTEGGRTFYAKYGDVFGYLCAFLLIVLWQIEPRLRKRYSR